MYSNLFDYQGKIHMMKKNGAGFAARVQKQDQTLVPPSRTNRLVTSSTKFEAVVSSTKKIEPSNTQIKKNLNSPEIVKHNTG